MFASLATVSPAQPQGSGAQSGFSAYSALQGNRGGVKTGLHFTGMRSAAAKNAAAAAAAGETIVTDTPAGEKKLYQRSSTSFYVDDDEVNIEDLEGYASEIVYGDDGKTVWLKNPIGEYETDSWLKGEKTADNKISFTLPQPILKEYSTTYYAYRLVSNSTRTDYLKPETQEEQTVEFTIDGDTLKQTDTDGEYILGLADVDGNWVGYGDYGIKLVEVKEAAVTPPDGLEYNDYSLKYENEDRKAKSVVIKYGANGSDVYLTGLPGQGKGTYIKGTVSGGKAVFKDKQYVGTNSESGTLTYFRTVTSKDSVSIITGIIYKVFNFADKDLEFDYDEATRTFKSSGEFMLVAGKDGHSFSGYFKEPKLRAILDEAATPRNPEFEDLRRLTDESSNGFVYFDVYPEDVDGNRLIEKKLYYVLYLDDKPFTFTSDVYTDMIYYTDMEEMTEVPYNFTDLWDINIGPRDTRRGIALYTDDYEKLGVQVIYKGGGETRTSDIVYYEEETTGISNPAVEAGSDARITDTFYTDLSGRRVSSPAKGIYLKTVKRADGTSKTVKVAVK